MQVISSMEYVKCRAKATAPKGGGARKQSQGSSSAESVPMECDSVKFNKWKR